VKERNIDSILFLSIYLKYSLKNDYWHERIELWVAKGVNNCLVDVVLICD